MLSRLFACAAALSKFLRANWQQRMIPLAAYRPSSTRRRHHLAGVKGLVTQPSTSSARTKRHLRTLIYLDRKSHCYRLTYPNV